MIKCNGKDIIPRLNGKELSRVMYNGKQIYPVIPFNGNIIYINQLESDPAKMISGDINGDIIQWIRNNSHRVLAKKTGEGTMAYAVLDDNNSTLYNDGTTADLTGIEGDVFVKLPTFYYAGNDDGTGASGNNVEIRFSKNPFENSIEWDTNILIGAYEACYKNSKLQSISGVESSGNITQTSFKKYARNRGTGYQLVDWQIHCVIGCLFYAIYGNTNCQVICGAGVQDINKITGQTNTLGMNDTQADINGNNQSINFLGLENWWGNKWEFIDDYENNANSNIAYVNDIVNGGKRQFNIPNSHGLHYPRKMKFGYYLDLITTDTFENSDANIGYCDSQDFPTIAFYSEYIASRSANAANNTGGVAHISCVNPPSASYLSNSSRLVFRGKCTEETDIATFKTLPIL